MDDRACCDRRIGRLSALRSAFPRFRSILARVIETAGDAPDVLLALNPAALKVKIDISKLTLEAVEEFEVTSKEGLRCKTSGR